MEISPIQKRTWAEINLDTIKNNFENVKKQLSKNVKICCVVKANAYGHGAVKLSKLYEKLGADFFAVSNIEEALQLREGGIIKPILILGYTDPSCAKILVDNNISQCVFSLDYAKALSKSAIQNKVLVKIHLKIDTGMGRIGFAYKKSENQIDDALKACGFSGLIKEGIFTHFAVADEKFGKEYTKEQFENFTNAIKYLEDKGQKFNIKHCANSAAIYDYANAHFDMVRAGVVLYGLCPSTEMVNMPNIKPAVKLKTVVDYIKNVKKGESVSYGREFIAQEDMTVATLPIGYADGLFRANYKKGLQVEVDGKPARIIGRICMDQCMIDLSNVKGVKIGDVVEVYGDKKYNSIDTIAKINETINYEIICAIGERVPRVYVQNKKIVEIRDNILKS